MGCVKKVVVCVLQKKEAAEINGKPEKQGKAMLAMHHYLKESDTGRS